MEDIHQKWPLNRFNIIVKCKANRINKRVLISIDLLQKKNLQKKKTQYPKPLKVFIKFQSQKKLLSLLFKNKKLNNKELYVMNCKK